MIVRRLIILMLMMTLGQASHAWAQDSEASSEYLIKAGYIYNFAKLVEWPATAFALPSEEPLSTRMTRPASGKQQSLSSERSISSRDPSLRSG